MKPTTGEIYALVIAGPTPVVAGVRLREFSIGHALLLLRRKSPFAALYDEREPGTVGLGSLALALWVCSRPATVAIARQPSWIARFLLRRIAARLKPHADDLDLFTEDLSGYIAESWSGPKIGACGDVSTCGAPALALLKTSLMSGFGFSEREALDYGVRRALWDRAAWLESQGLIRFWTDGDEDFLEEAKKMAREDGAEMAAGLDRN